MRLSPLHRNQRHYVDVYQKLVCPFYEELCLHIKGMYTTERCRQGLGTRVEPVGRRPVVPPVRSSFVLTAAIRLLHSGLVEMIRGHVLGLEHGNGLDLPGTTGVEVVTDGSW